VIACCLRWGQSPQHPQQQQHSFFYSRTFSLPAVDGRLPEILFSGGEHPDPTNEDQGGGVRTNEKSPRTYSVEECPSSGGYLKCPRCAKYFVSFGQLKEHQAAAHQDVSNAVSLAAAAATKTRIFKYRKGASLPYMFTVFAVFQIRIDLNTDPGLDSAF